MLICILNGGRKRELVDRYLLCATPPRHHAITPPATLARSAEIPTTKTIQIIIFFPSKSVLRTAATVSFLCRLRRRIDFRELVRDLFSLYKTRIWMQQLEPETTPSGGTIPSPYSPQVTPHIVDTQASGPMGMGMGGSML